MLYLYYFAIFLFKFPTSCQVSTDFLCNYSQTLYSPSILLPHQIRMSISRLSTNIYRRSSGKWCSNSLTVPPTLFLFLWSNFNNNNNNNISNYSNNTALSSFPVELPILIANFCLLLPAVNYPLSVSSSNFFTPTVSEFP